MISLPLDLKRLFLNFLQEYFKQTSTKYYWSQDIRTTKIIIVDKYSFDPAVVERAPAIVMSRSSMQWSYNTITGQKTNQNTFNTNATRTDLVRSGFTFSCLSQNGIEAEELANELFYIFFGYRDEFRAHGIFSIQPVTIGDEQLIRGDSKARTFMVPVNVMFQYQGTIVKTHDSYSITVLVNTAEVRQYTDYTTDWDQITFVVPPKIGSIINVTYKNAITLGTVAYTIPALQIDGVRTVFTLPSSVYGDQPILRKVDVTYPSVILPTV